MAFILNIDTAIDSASIALSRDGKVFAESKFEEQKEQAGWLHQEIRNILEINEATLFDLEAVAVSIGPGSYTGLRVGLSTAKGLCFAIGIPLITLNTLEAMTYGIKIPGADFICSLIDARRMEVFTAVYDKEFKEILAPTALVITKDSFDFLLTKGKVIFIGNGNRKFKEITSDSNATFSGHLFSATDMIPLAEEYFKIKKFSDLAYIEPFYLKEFFSPVVKVKG